MAKTKHQTAGLPTPGTPERSELVAKLHGWGWFQGYAAPPMDIDDIGLTVVLRGYQTFHGIPATGLYDVTTIGRMNAPRCALPDVMPFADRLCKWNHKEVSWIIIADLPRLDRATFRGAVAEAFSYWQAVCGLLPREVASANEADIVIQVRSIDTSGQVLAESELPCGATRKCRQWYDTNENWIIAEVPRNGIDLVRVACHELGHALGMGHIGSGNLLAPIYSPSIRRPQQGDIAEMRSRYGPPVSAPPTPQPTPGTPTVPPSLPGGSMLGTLLKLLPLIAKYLPMIVQYLPDIIKLIEELGKIFKQNPAAFDAFVAELKVVDHEQLRQAMTAPQAFTSDDVAALIAQLIELLRSLAAAVGVHVVVGPKVTVGVDVKKDQPK